MRQKTLVSVLVALAFAISSVANAVPIVYTAALSGANESPPSGSLGVGTAIVTVDADPAVMTMRVQATFAGLGSGTTIAHIHCCLALGGPPNVGVATQTPTFPSFPAGVTSGSYDQTFDLNSPATSNPTFITNFGGGDYPTARAAFLNGLNTGATYFNIHTSGFQAGEIRGILYPVPEPGTLALIGLTLAALVGRERRV